MQKQRSQMMVMMRKMVMMTLRKEDHSNGDSEKFAAQSRTFFRRFRLSLNILGCFFNLLDVYGSILMCSDAFGCACIPLCLGVFAESENFGKKNSCLSICGHVWFFPSVSGGLRMMFDLGGRGWSENRSQNSEIPKLSMPQISKIP